ncbi:phosphoglycerate kinase, partial [Candidatus Babeliales bacterium]|nr:phosphoglycerate kinase [Candidatus Babeliales bacterium]
MHAYSLDTMQLTGEIVFVRIDGNVPSDEYGNITDDFRLKAVLKTIKYISERADVTIIGTHRGRPDQSESLRNQALSNNILCHWFQQQGLVVHFFEDLFLGLAAAVEKKYSIILLENLRYYQGEKDDSSWLSDKIASVATIY